MEDKGASQKQILKSTGIIGGAQVITIIIRILRTKIVALLLGPEGVGLVGLYQSTITLISGATNFGLGFSAVKDIAEANAGGDKINISKVILVLRRWVWLTGVFGMSLTIVFSRELSTYAFGNTSKAWAFVILSIIVLITALSSGQLALLQGLRQISKMAKANVFGVVSSFFVVIPIYYIYKFDGIVPALLLTSLITLIFSWWFSKDVLIEKVTLSTSDTLYKGMGMAKLGFSMVVAGLLTTATMYGVRIFLSQKLNIEAVGLFQAAWAISTIYLGMVLDAMSKDYFPRLSAVNKDNIAINKLVNEQTEIGLLIAVPLVISMISFLPFIIKLLYSSKFEAAIPLMQWMIPGMFLRVIGWPMGYVVLAKGKGKIFILTQFIWNAVFITSIYFGFKYLNIEIVGIGFLIAYFIGVSINFFLLRGICDFKWTSSIVRMIFVSLAVVIISSMISTFISSPYKILLGFGLTGVVSYYAYTKLNRIINLLDLIKRFKKRS